MSAEQLLRSLGLAVEAAPDDVPLRLHFAQLLAADGQRTEAVRQAAAVLLRDPDNAQAMQLLTQVPPASEPPLGEPTDPAAREPSDPAREPTDAAREPSDPAAREPSSPADAPPVRPDWETLQELDAELSEIAPPMFSSDEPTVLSDVERTGLRLADVGGMEEVKARLDAAFLAPLRNPELRAVRQVARRAAALRPARLRQDLHRARRRGRDGREVHLASRSPTCSTCGSGRASATCTRSSSRPAATRPACSSSTRSTRSARSAARCATRRRATWSTSCWPSWTASTGDNEGVFVLAATNHPWDVDTALRRPGRFDRTVLVLPPDRRAREAILRYHLEERPIAGIDVPQARRAAPTATPAPTSRTSARRAAELALHDSVGHRHRAHDRAAPTSSSAVRDVRPSTGPWLDDRPQRRPVRQRGRHVRRPAGLPAQAAPGVTSADSEHSLAMQRGDALCDLGRFADAERLLEGAVGRQPQDPRAWCLLARAQLGTSHYDAALRSAQTATSLAPEAEWGHRLRSIALVGMRQESLGVEAAQAAVRVAPHTWQTHHCLANALTSTNHRAPEAIEAALRAVALAPHEAEAHFALGAATKADGQRDRARDAFQSALALDPQHSGAHNELARLQLGRRLPAGPKRLANAASGFATSLRADPTGSTARHNLDLVLRSFLSRLSYLIFVAAYVLLRVDLGSGPWEHALPLLLLSVPAYVAARFVLHLPPPLRAHLVALVTSRRFAVGTGLLTFAVGCLAVSSVASGSARQAFSVVAVVAALIGRLLVERELHEAAQRGSGQPHKPWIRSGLLTIFVIVLFLTAVIAFATVQSSDSIALSFTAGMTCLLGGAAISAHPDPPALAPNHAQQPPHRCLEEQQQQRVIAGLGNRERDGQRQQEQHPAHDARLRIGWVAAVDDLGVAPHDPTEQSGRQRAQGDRADVENLGYRFVSRLRNQRGREGQKGDGQHPEHQQRGHILVRAHQWPHGPMLGEPEPRDHHETEQERPELRLMPVQQMRDRVVLPDPGGQLHQRQDEQRDRDRRDCVDESEQAVQVALTIWCGRLIAHTRRVWGRRSSAVRRSAPARIRQ